MTTVKDRTYIGTTARRRLLSLYSEKRMLAGDINMLLLHGSTRTHGLATVA